MSKKELITVLRTSIRSTRMLELVSIGVVKVADEYIIIKQRPAYEFTESEAIHYAKEHDMTYSYSELIGKIVVYGHNLFNRSGQAAIREYMKVSNK